MVLLFTLHPAQPVHGPIHFGVFHQLRRSGNLKFNYTQLNASNDPLVQAAMQILQQILWTQ